MPTSKKNPPVAPPVYRPQALPRVLQRKSNRAAGQVSIHKSSPARIVQLSHGRNSIIQRAQQAPRAGNSSGRSATELWRLFCTYKKQQAEDIEWAFLGVGYTADTVQGAVERCIRSLGLDLSAHGTGQPGDPVQGELDQEAATWVTKMTLWAASHPAGVRVVDKGLRHTPEEEEASRQVKLVKKGARALEKKEQFVADCRQSGKHYAPGGNPCKFCGGV